MKNPFITNGYAGAEYFCDRVTETSDIRSLLENENNIALISPRRIGKTELINHIFDCDKFRDEYHCFIVDIYATKSLSDMVNMVGKVVLDELKPKGRSVWEKFVTGLTSLRSEISFDINGLPSWNVGLGELKNASITLDEIFSYLQNADKPCIVAIDEFQQITKYGDETIEATLRTYVQKTTNAHFIFSGSQRHLMNEMFTSHSRPFYQSVTIINLQPLPLERYNEFAREKFAEAGYLLNPSVIETLYSRYNGVTSYIHRILNILFSRMETGRDCTEDMIASAEDFIVRLSSDTYESLFYQMPLKQRSVFLAIAAEGTASEVMSSAFVKRHSLVSASSASAALKGLLDKDFITKEAGVYSASDKFFVLWLRSKHLI